MIVMSGLLAKAKNFDFVSETTKTINEHIMVLLEDPHLTSITLHNVSL
jgi:hypothetical protein